MAMSCKPHVCVSAAWFSPLYLGAIAVAGSLVFKAPFVKKWRYAKEVSVLADGLAAQTL